MSERKWTHCQCGKVWSETKGQARSKYQHMTNWTYQNGRGDWRPVRYYQCRFGGWHWTQVLDHPGFEQPMRDPNARPEKQWAARHEEQA